MAANQGPGPLAKTIAQFKERNARLGLSPRQQRLNKYWSYYRCQHYDVRSMNWDGSKRDDPIEHEAIASIGYIPPGFYDASGQSSTLPLRYRRPTAPYNLAKVITDRLTGLLFSHKRHPSFTVDDDPEAETFLNKIAEAARIWPNMIQARTFGGAQGTVALGFSFIDGRPVIEVHDPRWLYPDFEDRLALKLRRLEKRFMYPVDVQNQETGIWEEKAFWYRRLIDKTADVVFQPVEVGDGEEPEWKEASRVDHKLGFCPVVWLQNLPVLDDIDGDSDCHGIYDLIESHDALVAQAYKALIANCDPTVVIVSKAENLKEVAIGGDNAIKLPDGDAKFLEHAGEGPKATLELADKIREMALEVAQTVLEVSDQTIQTATEVERRYSSMLSKGDILREQYGEKGVKQLILMMTQAAEVLGKPETIDGEVTRQGVRLGGSTDELFVVPAGLLSGANVQLQWPPYFEPSLDDVQKATLAASQAMNSKIIDRTHAVKFVSQMFGVDDVQGLVDQLDQEEEDNKQQMFAAMGGGPPPGQDESDDGGGGGGANGGGNGAGGPQRPPPRRGADQPV